MGNRNSTPAVSDRREEPQLRHYMARIMQRLAAQHEAARHQLASGIPKYQQTYQRIVHEKKLQSLPGLISLTSEPDCLTFDDDPNTERARMPCGHVFGVDTMTMFAKSTVNTDFKFIFKCPAPTKHNSGEVCGAVWDYALVRHVAAFTDEEKKTLEKKLGELYMTKSAEARQCPACGVYCFREDKTLKRVRCPVCLNTNSKTTDFCWACLGSWKTSNTNNCGNSYCNGKDPRLNVLAVCGKKRMGHTNILCPVARACPKCGVIIEHVGGCKEMQCYSCEVYFCFVCLSLKGKGQYHLPCGKHNVRCNLAPVQTHITGSD